MHRPKSLELRAASTSKSTNLHIHLKQYIWQEYYPQTTIKRGMERMVGRERIRKGGTGGIGKVKKEVTETW